MHVNGLVVVGAGLAGLRACEAARRAGFDGPVTLVGSEVHLPYDRPPLSKEYLDEKVDDLHYKDLSTLRDELRIDVRTGTAATGLDVHDRVVQTTAGPVPYDELVLAPGAAARTLPAFEGIEPVVTVRTLDDAQRLRGLLTPGTRVLVIGAGFVGAEVASAARSRDLPTTVIEALEAPLVRSLGAEVGSLCARLHTDAGTDLRLGVTIDGVRQDADAITVSLSDGTSVTADLVVVGIGARPATEWLPADQVAIEPDGSIRCDETLAVLDPDGSVVPHVWAAGDAASWVNPAFERRMRLEHWTSAAEQGDLAARNALGEEPAPYETVPYFWSDWYGIRLQFVGIPVADEILVQQRTDDAGGTVALYREGDRLVGAFVLGRPALTMKYRRLIRNGASWDEGVQFGADKSA